MNLKKLNYNLTLPFKRVKEKPLNKREFKKHLLIQYSKGTRTRKNKLKVLYKGTLEMDSWRGELLAQKWDAVFGEWNFSPVANKALSTKLQLRFTSRKLSDEEADVLFENT